MRSFAIATILIGGLLCFNAQSSREYKENFRHMSYQQAISEVKTPRQAERYLLVFLSSRGDAELFGEEDYVASFSRIHKNEKDDCDGAALAAAALLSDNGFPPLMLCMYNKENDFENLGGHGVYIYQQGEKWGTLGIGPFDCQVPRWDSIEKIVQNYGYEKFNVINIAEQYSDWLTNSVNMNKRIYRPDLAKFL